MTGDWLDLPWHWPTWPGSAPVACGDPDTEACTDPGCPLHSGGDEVTS